MAHAAASAHALHVAMQEQMAQDEPAGTACCRMVEGLLQGIHKGSERLFVCICLILCTTPCWEVEYEMMTACNHQEILLVIIPTVQFNCDFLWLCLEEHKESRPVTCQGY